MFKKNISEITVPDNSLDDFEEGEIPPGATDYNHFKKPVEIKDIKSPIRSQDLPEQQLPVQSIEDRKRYHKFNLKEKSLRFDPRHHIRQGNSGFRDDNCEKVMQQYEACKFDNLVAINKTILSNMNEKFESYSSIESEDMKTRNRKGKQCYVYCVCKGCNFTITYERTTDENKTQLIYSKLNQNRIHDIKAHKLGIRKYRYLQMSVEGENPEIIEQDVKPPQPTIKEEDQQNDPFNQYKLKVSDKGEKYRKRFRTSDNPESAISYTEAKKSRVSGEFSKEVLSADTLQSEKVTQKVNHEFGQEERRYVNSILQTQTTQEVQPSQKPPVSEVQIPLRISEVKIPVPTKEVFNVQRYKKFQSRYLSEQLEKMIENEIPTDTEESRSTVLTIKQPIQYIDVSPRQSSKESIRPSSRTEAHENNIIYQLQTQVKAERIKKNNIGQQLKDIQAVWNNFDVQKKGIQYQVQEKEGQMTQMSQDLLNKEKSEKDLTIKIDNLKKELAQAEAQQKSDFDKCSEMKIKVQIYANELNQHDTDLKQLSTKAQDSQAEETELQNKQLQCDQLIQKRQESIKQVKDAISLLKDYNSSL